MKIAIINYGAGNIKSIQNALDFLNISYFIANTTQQLTMAEKIILPGVGAAKNAMQSIDALGIRSFLQETQKPVLGICLGLQLFSDYSEEDNISCFGIIEGEVRRFPRYVKAPQVGWNTVHCLNQSPLFLRINDGSFFYFVHSYYFDAPVSFTLGQTDYGVSFPSVIQKENFYATQFHPEKSGEPGLQLLNNFCTQCL